MAAVRKLHSRSWQTGTAGIRTHDCFHFGFQSSVTEDHLPSSSGRLISPKWLNWVLWVLAEGPARRRLAGVAVVAARRLFTPTSRDCIVSLYGVQPIIEYAEGCALVENSHV
jgi:hypothetical protein